MFFSGLVLALGLGILAFWGRGWYESAREKSPAHARRLLGAACALVLFLILAKMGFPPLLDLAAGALAYYALRLPSSLFSGSVQPPAEMPPQGSMKLREARLILGVGEGASAEEIQTAWRTMMQRNHPDAGGSAYVAAQINLARDTLLDKTP